MRGLRFLKRCSDGSLNVASYHHPRSITWRWGLNIGRYRGLREYRWGAFFGKRSIGTAKITLNLGAITMRWSTQRPMWRT